MLSGVTADNAEYVPVTLSTTATTGTGTGTGASTGTGTGTGTTTSTSIAGTWAMAAGPQTIYQAGNLFIMSPVFYAGANAYVVPQNLTVNGTTIGYDAVVSDYANAATSGDRGYVRRFDGTISGGTSISVTSADQANKVWGGYVVSSPNQTTNTVTRSTPGTDSGTTVPNIAGTWAFTGYDLRTPSTPLYSSSGTITQSGSTFTMPTNLAPVTVSSIAQGKIVGWQVQQNENGTSWRQQWWGIIEGNTMTGWAYDMPFTTPTGGSTRIEVWGWRATRAL